MVVTRHEPGMGRFTSDAARQRFLVAYDAAMGLWPGPREQLDVETADAVTHVHRYGPATGEPFVLLHGAAGNASMWFPNVAALGERRPVYALDTPGDPGRSRQHRPIHQPADAARWLDDVLTGLGVERAHLVGASYGGWLALNLAVRAPDRVASASMVDPAGLERIGARFYLWLLGSSVTGLLPGFGRGAVHDTPELRRCTMLGAVGYRNARPSPGLFTDDELRGIGVPTSFLLGARSPVLHPAPTRDRIRALVPGARVEIVPGTGHGPSIERPGYVNARLLELVEGVED